MKRSRLQIALVSTVFLVSVLVIFQTTYGQTGDYVVETDRGSDNFTTTTKVKVSTVNYTCNVCGKNTSHSTY